LAREHEIKLEQLNQQKMEAIYFAEKDLLSKNNLIKIKVRDPLVLISFFLYYTDRKEK